MVVGRMARRLTLLTLLQGCGSGAPQVDGGDDAGGRAGDGSPATDAAADGSAAPDVRADGMTATDAMTTTDAPPATDAVDAADAHEAGAASDAGPPDAPAGADGGDASAGDAGTPDTAGPCEVVRTLSAAESAAYAPLAIGDRWSYRGRSYTVGNESYAPEFQVRLEVTGTKPMTGGDSFVVANTNATGNPFASEEYLSVTGAGMVNNGTPASTPLPGTTPGTAPYTDIQFPVRVCAAFEQFNKVLTLGVNTSVYIGVAVARSIGSLTLAGGQTFPDALRIERMLTTQPVGDGGAAAPSVASTSVDWYVPGIGRVKRSLLEYGRVYETELTGLLIDGAGRGVLPGGNLTSASHYSSFLGGTDRPAVASDGKTFLVLTSSSSPTTYDSMGTMLATQVAPDGTIMKSTTVAMGGRVPQSPALAFGDTSYLAVFANYNSTVKAMMLAPDGTQMGSMFDIWGGGAVAVAYGRGVFLVVTRHNASDLGITLFNGQGTKLGEVIPYPGQKQGSPAIAFDGKNFLIAYLNTTTELPNGASTHVWAARVNADGNAIDVTPTQITTAAPLQEDVDVAFDGTRYVVSWQHRAQQSSIGSGELRIARVGVDGVLLDPAGRVVVPARNNTSKVHPRIGRLGSQALLVWTRINYQPPTSGLWIAGTRIDANGNSLDSSATDDGLVISAVGTHSEAIMPNLGWGPGRNMVVFVDRAGEAMMKRELDYSMVYPW